VPLAALIVAQDQTDIGDGLRATLPLAGRSLIEYQAGLALAAGAEHILILVERVPAALAQAVDRLRRGQARVEIARSLADAIDRLHPEERILLFADGAIAAQAAVDRLARAAPPALLALPDTPEYADFERIDAAERWAGFALFGKGFLEATAQMLGDWDLGSTLLRRLVQGDAARIAALDPGAERALPTPMLVTGPAALGAIEAGLLRRANSGEGNWAEVYLHQLVATPLIGPLVGRQVDQALVVWAGAGIAWLGALAAAFQILWGAALLLPLGAAVASAGRRMARIWGGAAEPLTVPTLARYAAAFAALLLLARLLSADGGWGWWLVAVIVPAALLGLAGLEPIVAAVGPRAAPRWQASADALVWIAPLLAVLGGWRWMLAALALYAVGCFLKRFTVAWKGARICDK
jgi:hypothetical protein